MMKRSLRLLFLTLAILIIHSAAHADGITPMMFAGISHLVLGNLLIGIGEGLLIGWLFKAKKGRAIGIMILANYFSGFAGACLSQLFKQNTARSYLMSLPLYDIPKLLWALAAATLLVTIVLEWPFCLWVLKKSERIRTSIAKTSLYASILAQIASYCILVPWYLTMGGLGFFNLAYSHVNIERDLTSFCKNRGAVYCISPADGDIYQVRMDGSGYHKVLQADVTSPEARLFFRPSKDGQNLDLWYSWTRTSYDLGTRIISPVWKLLKKNFVPATFTPAELSFNDEAITTEDVSDIRPVNQGDWEVSTSNIDGEFLVLEVENVKTKASYTVGFETPFINWSSTNATVLPGDQVIYQLGSQIVLLDLNTRKMAMVAVGRGPVIALDGKE